MNNVLKHAWLFSALVLFLAGCGRDASFEEPPRERHNLVMRFFESMQKNASAEAAQQGRNLIKLDVANQYLWELVYIQEYNFAIQEAQKAVNLGRFDEAKAALARGVKKVPDNRALLAENLSLQRLTDARGAFAVMEKAPDSAAMEKALARAEKIAAPGSSAKLDRYYASYRKRITLRKEVEAMEKAETAAEMEAALLHAEKTAGARPGASMSRYFSSYRQKIAARKALEARLKAEAEAKAKAEAEAKAKAEAEAKAKAAARPGAEEKAASAPEPAAR